MDAVLTIQDPRDTDSVLIRVPAGLRRRVQDEAKDLDISQNTFITASLLHSTVVFGRLPYVGMPQVLALLLDEMDRVAEANDVLLLALNEKDWNSVRPVIELFADSGMIEGLKARRDVSAHDTIAFTFRFSRVGLAVWKLIGSGLRKAVEIDEVKAATLSKVTA